MSMNMVLKLYISAGVPRSVIADIKLATNERATGNTDILPPARRYAFVLV
uniref:Uncharacterized protein n=1 Tax=Octopus bimaculoides TaxID=37653 RepID=A0A0L8HFJ0_OCTBM